MIFLDTGPIVAFFDASDDYHRRCVEILKGIKEPMITSWPVLTEAFYLLGFSWKAQDNLWEFLQRGGVEVLHLSVKMKTRCRELMGKYRDLPMDLADATAVALAESQRISKVFTLDHRDFKIYKPAHLKCFTLLPAHL
ncbi:MAG: PIN domain nuclease [Deltaproteobacteria bacterium]|nr:PIN domain-containing protein [Deltaproteobacteria bacterium]MBW2077088.1 PIN domain-containing protein [Deltaproteobacteria bacterium]MBW2310892.1 PIN domain-containing protein [Deltaproteobacteria bacterium]RLB32126.1 MAG: PIN domain nuclease [Deltaproteobacteria bacterium]